MGFGRWPQHGSRPALCILISVKPILASVPGYKDPALVLSHSPLAGDYPVPAGGHVVFFWRGHDVHRISGADTV